MIKNLTIDYFNNIRKIYKEDLSQNEKGLFIDCGGADGCSAIKFMMINPQFDCVTFEPNPNMWQYYETVPSTLIKKAVFNRNERKNFRIDGDTMIGSTLIPSKKILSDESIEIKTIKVECIRLGEFIEVVSKKYNKIILKLDVEGAEYDILEDLLQHNQIKNISKLYAEFHWNKCQSEEFTEHRHEILMHFLVDLLPICEWDASAISLVRKTEEYKRERDALVKKHFAHLKKYQTLNFGAMYE